MPDHTDVEGAFVQLIVSHQLALRAYVNSLMSGDQQAGDVLQEVNITIWKKRGEFSIGTNFKAWIFKIARFKVLSHWRDTKRSRAWAFPPETLEKIMHEAEDVGIEQLEERREMLNECLKMLRSEDQGLITHRYLQEMSLKQLAKNTMRSVNSLEVSLHRIRGALRDCIRRRMRRAKQTT